jgi:RNA polymerase sigma factor (sigma-70 family)
MILTTETEKEIKHLYKKWPEIKHFLAQLGCSKENAEDVFQEALLIYVRKKNEIDFDLKVEPIYYVKNTCKFLWYNQARKTNRIPQTDFPLELESFESPWMEKELKLQQVESVLGQLGKQCQEILQLFYGLGWNMVDIAQKIGLRNDKVAKAQKYRCVQMAKDLMESNPISETSFIHS